MRTKILAGIVSVLAVLVVLPSNVVLADTLNGTFTFKKKPPSVALLYFPEDTSLSSQVQTVIDQNNKQFSQKLYVTTKGANAIFKNSDSINHNIFANDKKSGVKFDVGLMQPSGSNVYEVEWQEKVVKCGCKIHPKMKTWIASISSQYYKIIEFDRSKKELAFDMNGFPENLSVIKLWMPAYEPIEVQLSKGESQAIELKKRGKIYGTLNLARK